MALQEGSRYGLLSRDSVIASNISCIHVKLTDAALKVIEDTRAVNRKGLSTLEVNDDHGLIRIPDGDSYKEFKFSVGPLPSDPKGSFDCVKMGRNGQLEMLDSMTHKISIRANEDVYQTTRDKLAVKNEESKKNCAKEIDQTHSGIKSKKVTKTIRNGNSLSGRSAAQSNMKQTKCDWPPSLAGRSPNPLTSAGVANNSTSPSNSSISNSQSINHGTQATSQTAAAKMLDKLKRKQQSKLNSAAKEAAVAHIKTSGPSRQDREKQKAALQAVPLRERVVHTLGLKPNMYDTPQLLLKLRADGLNENSSAEVTRLLAAVGSANSKGCWALRPEHLSEVDINWAFYSETDRQLVKRNLNRAGTKPVGEVHPTSDTSKRKIDKTDDSDLPPSKQKKNDIKQPASSSSPDFIEKYTAISNLNQRNQYKDDFNREYAEYKSLFDYFEKIENKFEALSRQLYSAQPGSSVYKKIEKKIRKKYKEIAYSEQYVTSKPRMDYLHRKLGHIKHRVHEYDKVNVL